MFTLAHLSDPHLAPLPAPHWTSCRQARNGLHQLATEAAFHPRAAALAAIVADIKAQSPDHIAVTGDIANIALAAEFPQGRDWLEALGPAQDVTFVPGNHDIYVREAALSPPASGARTCATTKTSAVSLRAPTRQCRADRAFNRRADCAISGDRLARHQAAGRAQRPRSTSSEAKRSVPHRTNSSSADQLRPPQHKRLLDARCSNA